MISLLITILFSFFKPFKLKIIVPIFLSLLILICTFSVINCNTNESNSLPMKKQNEDLQAINNFIKESTDILFISTKDGFLHALDKNKNELWKVHLERELISSNISTRKIRDDLFLYPFNERLYIYKEGKFISLDIFIKDLVKRQYTNINDMLLLGKTKTEVFIIDIVKGKIIKKSDDQDNLITKKRYVTQSSKKKLITVLRTDYILTCLGTQEEQKLWNASYSDITIQRGNEDIHDARLIRPLSTIKNLINKGNSGIFLDDIITVHSYFHNDLAPIKIFDRSLSDKFFDIKKNNEINGEIKYLTDNSNNFGQYSLENYGNDIDIQNRIEALNEMSKYGEWKFGEEIKIDEAKIASLIKYIIKYIKTNFFLIGIIIILSGEVLYYKVLIAFNRKATVSNNNIQNDKNSNNNNENDKKSSNNNSHSKYEKIYELFNENDENNEVPELPFKKNKNRKKTDIDSRKRVNRIDKKKYASLTEVRKWGKNKNESKSKESLQNQIEDTSDKKIGDFSDNNYYKSTSLSNKNDNNSINNPNNNDSDSLKINEQDNLVKLEKEKNDATLNGILGDSNNEKENEDKEGDDKRDQKYKKNQMEEEEKSKEKKVGIWDSYDNEENEEDEEKEGKNEENKRKDKNEKDDKKDEESQKNNEKSIQSEKKQKGIWDDDDDEEDEKEKGGIQKKEDEKTITKNSEKKKGIWDDDDDEEEDEKEEEGTQKKEEEKTITKNSEKQKESQSNSKSEIKGIWDEDSESKEKEKTKNNISNEKNNNKINIITNKPKKQKSEEIKKNIKQKEEKKLTRLDEDFENFEKLGQGGFGIVLKARHKIDKGTYAIKIIKLSGMRNKDDVINEAKTMLSINSKHIVQYKICWFQKTLGSAAKFFTSDDLSSSNTSESLMLSKSVNVNLSKINNNKLFNKIDDNSVIKEEKEENDDICYDDEKMSKKNEDNKSKKIKKRFYAEDEDNNNSSSKIKKRGIFKNESKFYVDFNDDSNMRLATKSIISSKYDLESEQDNGNEFFFILMEYCDGLTLENYIEQHRGGAIDRKIIYIFTYQIIKCLKKIHSNGIIHRDIKPANIFISNNQIKLGDFGLATKYQSNNKFLLTKDLTGWTPLYSAPEQKTSKIYNEKVDIFACGITLLEMCSCFDTGMERNESVKNLVNKNIICDKLKKNYPEESELILLMTKSDINERISADGILSSELFKKLGEIVNSP